LTLSVKKRTQVFDRDGWACVRCTKQNELTVHHRVNRGAGGSKLFDSLAFLLTMCNTCNGLFESDFEIANQARELGYKLLRNSKPPVDPTTIPVFYKKEGVWYLLDQEGNRRSFNG
jgi:hypothetical protein